MHRQVTLGKRKDAGSWEVKHDHKNQRQRRLQDCAKASFLAEAQPRKQAALRRHRERSTNRQPQNSLPEGEFGFTEKQANEPRPDYVRPPADASDIPNIALNLPPAKKWPIQVAMAFILFALTFLACGLGVHVQDRFIFGFLVLCIVGAMVGVGVSLARSIVNGHRSRTIPTESIQPGHPLNEEVLPDENW